MMGFWHTGYMEFHEPVGLGSGYPPSPPVYSCQQCGEEFSVLEDLRAHRFDVHPFSRPALLIRGIEVGNAPVRISRRVAASEIEVLKCEKALLNGNPILPRKLGSKLSRLSNEYVKIELSNDGVLATFELQIRIASEADILGVEQAFMEVAQRRCLDSRSIEDFITAKKRYRSAIDYLDGICEYLYGVLIKERAKDSSLPYEEYRIKFNRSADKLKDFHRPLANTIRALIDFHFNHFREAGAFAPGFRVGAASQRFNKWITGDVAAARAVPSSSIDDRLEKYITDYETERLLRWSVESSDHVLEQADEMGALLLKDLPEYDRTKLHILLAESYAEKGRRTDARKHARELRGNPAFTDWAERLISEKTKGK
jgi:hypothetical protein